MVKYSIILSCLILLVGVVPAFSFSKDAVISLDSVTLELQGHEYIRYENLSGPTPVTIILTKNCDRYVAYISNGRDGLVTKKDVECSSIVEWLFTDFVREWQIADYSESPEYTFFTYSFGFVNDCGEELAKVSTSMVFDSENFKTRIKDAGAFFLGLFLHDIIDKKLDELPIKDWKG